MARLPPIKWICARLWPRSRAAWRAPSRSTWSRSPTASLTDLGPAEPGNRRTSPGCPGSRRSGPRTGRPWRSRASRRRGTPGTSPKQPLADRSHSRRDSSHTSPNQAPRAGRWLKETVQRLVEADECLFTLTGRISKRKMTVNVIGPLKAETESPTDPSPRPSPRPTGRGRSLGSLRNFHGVCASSCRDRRFSLSPSEGERAGVRGLPPVPLPAH